MRSGVAASLATAAALAGCDVMLVDPAEVPDVALSVVASATSPGFGDLSFALARVDRVRLVVTANGGSREMLMPTRFEHDVLTLRTRLDLSEASGHVEIRADLFYDGVRPMFSGEATIDASNIAAAVPLELSPIASYLSVGPNLHAFSALGDTLALTAIARFASFDSIPGAVVEWTSPDPFIEIVSGNRAVSRANGFGPIVATSHGVSQHLLLRVAQVAALVAVAPADTTIHVGESFQPRMTFLDRNGYVAPPGGTYVSIDGSVVWMQGGRPTGRSPGTGYVDVTDNRTSFRINVTVIP